MATPSQNPFLLAADDPPALLPLLRAQPALASLQDSHGYSLLHAAASYNNLPLLQSLVNEFQVNVNLVDEDGETALFVAETVEVADTLVAKLHIDTSIRNVEGQTAEEKIRMEGDFTAVADYLRESRTRGTVMNGEGMESQELPPLPPGLAMTFGTTPEDEEVIQADPEFRRRIEELAARPNFQGEAGQRELRGLVQDALRGLGDGRNVRPRMS
jgi:uncharacterized protein